MTFTTFKTLFWIVLLPLSVLWAGLMKLRRKYLPIKDRYRFDTPIICIGNIHSGGSGKTPFLIEVTKFFKATHQVAILSRGYRSALSGVGSEVDITNSDGPNQYGDEPWMLANRLLLPVYIDKKRERAVSYLEKNLKPSVILMDDGFQYLRLSKKVKLILISTQKKIEESFCLPLGELREPFSAIREADAVVLTTGDRKDHASVLWENFLTENKFHCPIFFAERKVEGIFSGESQVSPSRDCKWGVFSGIENSAAFSAELKAIVGSIVYEASFADHFNYSFLQLDTLVNQGRKMGVEGWLTTDKDWYKVRGKWNYEIPLYSLRIKYEVDSNFWEFLRSRMA